ncbi:hypothetical protein [Lacticaseibacillus rhamnosus]|uniref:hypothetical protein n=1 Tax=Lacticaseibacillus rhamnosus TaxID=47715 RepID=UPI000497F3E7|nr:hypothetical protein [Lacticaseibacillus rhamnosus]
MGLSVNALVARFVRLSGHLPGLSGIWQKQLSASFLSCIYQSNINVASVADGATVMFDCFLYKILGKPNFLGYDRCGTKNDSIEGAADG